MNNTFLTIGYKNCYIHTWYTSRGVFKVQTQIGASIREHKTLVGAKRYITKNS